MRLITRRTPLSTSRHPAGFTLIELLIVIAIIAILAGLAFPALQGALNSGKKAQARNDVQQIAAAIRAFQLEYGRLPSSNVAGNDGAESWYSGQAGADLFNALAGRNETLNPRGIVFLEAKSAQGTKNGLSADGIFYDPWGSPYGVKMDESYNGKLEYFGSGGWGNANVLSSALVVSFGPNKKQEDPNQAGGDDITSNK